ncbi:hypothetical protein KI387_032389, partial [Taxus chinensis]
PDDEEKNGIYDEQEEEADEELEDPGGSRVHFLSTKGVDDEDDYDNVVTEMNSESYAVMTWEVTKKKEKVVQPAKRSKDYPITIL